jgi:hypothetical protein
MLDEAAWWDDLVTGLRPMSYGAKGVPARCLVSVGPTTAAKASSEGWRLRLRPNNKVKFALLVAYRDETTNNPVSRLQSNSNKFG